MGFTAGHIFSKQWPAGLGVWSIGGTSVSPVLCSREGLTRSFSLTQVAVLSGGFCPGSHRQSAVRGMNFLNVDGLL